MPCTFEHMFITNWRVRICLGLVFILIKITLAYEWQLARNSEQISLESGIVVYYLLSLLSFFFVNIKSNENE